VPFFFFPLFVLPLLLVTVLIELLVQHFYIYRFEFLIHVVLYVKSSFLQNQVLGIGAEEPPR
jgi:hypothetical protein